MRLILFIALLASTALSYAQYHPKCDCSWQGGDKRQYGACEAEIEITPFKDSNSSITNFFLEATVDTEKCTNVNYELYENGRFQSNGMIHVRDGSNSENINGANYSSTPQVIIKDCIVCQDKRFGEAESNSTNSQEVVSLLRETENLLKGRLARMKDNQRQGDIRTKKHSERNSEIIRNPSLSIEQMKSQMEQELQRRNRESDEAHERSSMALNEEQERYESLLLELNDKKVTDAEILEYLRKNGFPKLQRLL